MKISKIEVEEFEKIKKESTKAGKWKELIEEVLKEGGARMVEDITRGQIAALYRKALEAGLDVKTSYKNGFVLLAKKAEKKAK